MNEIYVGDSVYYSDRIAGTVHAEVVALRLIAGRAMADIRCRREPDGIDFTDTVPVDRLIAYRGAKTHQQAIQQSAATDQNSAVNFQ